MRPTWSLLLFISVLVLLIAVGMALMDAFDATWASPGDGTSAARAQRMQAAGVLLGLPSIEGSGEETPSPPPSTPPDAPNTPNAPDAPPAGGGGTAPTEVSAASPEAPPPADDATAAAGEAPEKAPDEAAPAQKTTPAKRSRGKRASRGEEVQGIDLSQGGQPSTLVTKYRLPGASHGLLFLGVAGVVVAGLLMLWRQNR